MPIEKEGNQARKQLLQRFIKPFLLRRKKEEVLLELPEKTEEVAHCELSLQQLRLYQRTLEASRQELMADLTDGSKPVPYLHVFALLMRLKQLCDHPALINQDVENFHRYESGKWELFVELLGQARESGQKVVVFSQYLGMLDIVEKYLKEENIAFASLRGRRSTGGGRSSASKKTRTVRSLWLRSWPQA